VSLALLRGDQGKRDEARDILTPVCVWFAEGFDTHDLKEAKDYSTSSRNEDACGREGQHESQVLAYLCQAVLKMSVNPVYPKRRAYGQNDANDPKATLSLS